MADEPQPSLEHRAQRGLTPGEWNRLTLDERVEYLRIRQLFAGAAVLDILGYPPDGRELSWPMVEQFKRSLTYVREKIQEREARIQARTKRRAAIGSYLSRGLVSACLVSPLLWLVKFVAGLALKHWGITP